MPTSPHQTPAAALTLQYESPQGKGAWSHWSILPSTSQAGALEGGGVGPALGLRRLSDSHLTQHYSTRPCPSSGSPSSGSGGVPESLLHCPFTLPPEHPPEFTCLPVATGTIAPHCPTQPLLTALAPSIHSIALPGLSLPQRPPSVPQTYRVCSLHRAFTLPSPDLEVLPWPARMAPSCPSMSPQMPLPSPPHLAGSLP